MTLALLALVFGAPGNARAQMSLVGGGAALSVQVRTYRDIPFKTVVRQQYDYSCGSAALATLLHYHYGVQVGEAEVFQKMYAVGDQAKIRAVGFSLLDMKRYLEANGFLADGYRVSLDKLQAAEVPAIAVISVGSYRHFVVIKGAKGGKILVGDPAQGLKVYSTKEFAKVWNGVIFTIHRHSGPAPAYNKAAEWTPRGVAPTDILSDSSLGAFTRELPPVYQVSTMIGGTALR